MLITESENQLFEEWHASWQTDGLQFVKDGMVCPVEYERAPVRLLFILKEANDPDNSFDLRELPRGDNIPWQTWNTVTRWIEGIEALHNDPPNIIPWNELKGGIPINRLQKALRKIIVVNLKKQPGGANADLVKLGIAVCRDREFIRRQLALYLCKYAPNYVICCSDAVTELLFGVVYQQDNVEWTQPSRGEVGYTIANGTPHFSAYHPGARIAGNVLHYGLIDAVADYKRLHNAGVED